MPSTKCSNRKFFQNTHSTLQFTGLQTKAQRALWLTLISRNTKRITINPLITRNNSFHFHKILNSLTCIFDICIQPFRRTKEAFFSIRKKTLSRLFFGIEWRHLEFKELIILCIIIISWKSIRKLISLSVSFVQKNICCCVLSNIRFFKLCD